MELGFGFPNGTAAGFERASQTKRVMVFREVWPSESEAKNRKSDSPSVLVPSYCYQIEKLNPDLFQLQMYTATQEKHFEDRCTAWRKLETGFRGLDLRLGQLRLAQLSLRSESAPTFWQN